MPDTDPAVQAAIEAARTMQRRWHSDDTEAVCRAAVEAARPIIEAEALNRMADDLGKNVACPDCLRAAAVRTEPEDG